MAIASCAIALFVAEKIVGVTHPQLTYSRAQAFSFKATSKSDYLPFTLRPNHSSIHTASDGEFSYAVKINSLGYRMDEFPAQKPNDEFRILILGDSMTFGWGVDVKDNLPSKLEALINSRLPRENRSKRYVRIINAGFKNARSPDAFYLYLKKEGLTLDPDLIIVNYFPANDIEDLDDTEWEKVDGSNLPEKIVSKSFYVDGDDLRRRPEYRKLEHAFPLLRDSNLWVLFVDTVEARLPKVANLMKRWVGIRDYLASNPRENNRCLRSNLHPSNGSSVCKVREACACHL